MGNITATPMEAMPEKRQTTVGHKILTVIGVVLSAVLLPILILNCVLIWQAYRYPNSVPKFGGIVPMIAQTDVMYPDIRSGDLIICRSAEADRLREGDIITFVNARTTEGISVGVNRITEVISKDGAAMVTVTDQESEESEESGVREIPAEDVIGVYRGRFPGLGKLILFMQTTQGMILCVVLPILLLVGYDVLRTRMGEKRSREETARLAAELEALRKARYGQASKGGMTPQ